MVGFYNIYSSGRDLRGDKGCHDGEIGNVRRQWSVM